MDLYVIAFKEIAALDDQRNRTSPEHVNKVIQELNSFHSFQSAIRFGEQSLTGYLILSHYKQTLAGTSKAIASFNEALSGGVYKT